MSRSPRAVARPPRGPPHQEVRKLRTRKGTEMVTKAVETGKATGHTVQAWGSDMVRVDGSKIMSASDAVKWMTTGRMWWM